ncbi:helix-turn-helix domain-containing protein [Sphaerisporangium siamense]|uniref:DNA-binding CsgD family transcriptional regulator n=1 Tax=Sphaerisporangium siamense TaxID=795645 RepID=A0A7W7GB24_9ACTN|nr:helix-turn-helix domain-containing protein [Sphaerisporangium siamense]MBB4702355.1 DNA-binding CsgD family transcriptional regulator [Sphaerisporangium siamense]
MGPLEPTLTDLVTGKIASVATEAGELRIYLEAIGTEPPRPVLLIAGTAALARPAVSLASHAGGIVAALCRAREAAQASRAYRDKAHRVRLALAMTLLTGDVTLARRISTGAVPPLLNASRLRVCILQCPPAERDHIAWAHEDASGYHGRGLMVRCPVYDEHLISLAGEDEDEEPGADRRGLPGLLRSLADDRRYLLGISRPHPLAATARAYQEALHALAAAGGGASRAAVFQGEPSLEEVLPREAARHWARRLLAPLDAAPRLTVDVLALVLQLPRSGVANLLGISRNTVTAHLRRAEEALGLDLDDVGCRATLSLALKITGPGSGDSPEPAALPDFARALRGQAAHQWAEGFLQPLDKHTHRCDLHTTLKAWIEAGIDAQETAHRLGISRNTVRAHLITAQHLLNRDLLSGGPGVYDLAHALHITGHIAIPALLP